MDNNKSKMDNKEARRRLLYGNQHLRANPNMPRVERKLSDSGVTPSFILTPEIAARAYRPVLRSNPGEESIGGNLNVSSAGTATGNYIEVIRQSLLSIDLAKSSEEAAAAI